MLRSVIFLVGLFGISESKGRGSSCRRGSRDGRCRKQQNKNKNNSRDDDFFGDELIKARIVDLLIRSLYLIYCKSSILIN